MVYKKGNSVKAGPASKKAKKSYPLTRSDEILEDVLGTFLDSQNKDKDQLTDVHLVCKDGVIPVHAIILKSASNLFAEALESQGESYVSVRQILLPDYYVKEIRDVVQIIYTGTARFSDNDDAKRIEDILKEFCVDNVKNSKSKGKVNEDTNTKLVRCYLTKRINHPPNVPEKNILELKPLFGNQVEEEKKQNPSTSKSLRKRQVETKKSSSASSSSSDSDSDYSPERENRRKSPRKASKLMLMPRVVAEKLVMNTSKPTTTSSTNVQNSTSNNATVPVKKVNYYNYNGKQYENNEDDNEPDSDEWEEPDYNNKAWFETEARRCQKCQKQHSSPAEASKCITGHSRLRCYFCFSIAKNTEKLFEHFTKKHKQAGRDNCLMCPYCEQTVPFKSVSCHVISIHLSENRGQIKSTGSSGPGRPSGIISTVQRQVVTPTPNNSVKTIATAAPKESAKKTADELIVSSESALTADDGLLRVGDLDVTIRNKLGNGKIMVYHLQKNRSET